MTIKVAVLIPSYKRPEVLRKTIASLISWTSIDTMLAPILFEVGLFVAVNEYTQEDMEVITSFIKPALDAKIKYAWVTYTENKGKAAALNDLFDKFSDGYDYIITMDNDMVIKNTWLHLVDAASRTALELVGFGSSTFWAHQPRRELLEGKYFTLMDTYNIYNIDQIAGGMLLFPRKTLEEHKWTNKGGVYGFDDAQMCLDVKKKGVIHWPQDWLDHDPLGSSTPGLKYYHDRKQQFFDKGQYILPEGWDK